jgi:hypothetical protein
VSRYQFSAIMMLLWGILGRVTEDVMASTFAFFCGFLYAIGACVALWKDDRADEATP